MPIKIHSELKCEKLKNLVKSIFEQSEQAINFETIDTEIYSLYNLSDEEIEHVEKLYGEKFPKIDEDIVIENNTVSKEKFN